MKHRVLATGLAAAMIAGAGGLSAQPDDLSEARLVMGVVVQALLPEGWQLTARGQQRIEITHAATERLILIESPSDTLRQAAHYPGTVHHRPGMMFGVPVSLYQLPSSRYDGPSEMLLALLPHCIRPVTEDQTFSLQTHYRQRSGAEPLVAPVLIGFRNPVGIGDFDLGGAFDAVLEGLTLSLPSHLADCPADLDAPLQATAPPVAQDGWVTHSLMGIDLSLPERFFLAFGAPEDGSVEFEAMPSEPDGNAGQVMLTTDAEIIDEILDELRASDATRLETPHPVLSDFTSYMLDASDDPTERIIVRVVLATATEGRFALVLVSQIDGKSVPQAIIAGHDEIVQRLAPAGSRPAPVVAVAVPAAGGRLVLRDAQTDVVPFEHVFDSGLVLRARVPAGWEPDPRRREVTLANVTPPRRAIVVRADSGPGVGWYSYRGPRHMRRATLAGHPVTIIHGQSAETFVGSMEEADQGDLIAAVLERCLDTGNPINPRVFSLLLYSEAGHAGAVPDPVIAALLEDFELVLPEGTIPCPADLLDGLEALAE